MTGSKAGACAASQVNAAEKHSVETRFREEPDLWRIKFEDNVNNNVVLRSLGASISMADIYEDIIFPEKRKNNNL